MSISCLNNRVGILRLFKRSITIFIFRFEYYLTFIWFFFLIPILDEGYLKRRALNLFILLNYQKFSLFKNELTVYRHHIFELHMG